MELITVRSIVMNIESEYNSKPGLWTDDLSPFRFRLHAKHNLTTFVFLLFGIKTLTNNILQTLPSNPH